MAEIRLPSVEHKLVHSSLTSEIRECESRGESFPHHKILSPFPVATFEDDDKQYVFDELMEEYEVLYKSMLNTRPDKYAFHLWSSCTYNDFVTGWEQDEIMYEMRNRRYGLFSKSQLDMGWLSNAVMPGQPMTSCVAKTLELINRVFSRHGRFNSVVLLASTCDNEVLPRPEDCSNTIAILTLGSDTMIGPERSLTLRQGPYQRAYRVPGCNKLNYTLVFYRANTVVNNN